jgi:hypothetical protein
MTTPKDLPPHATIAASGNLPIGKVSNPAIAGLIVTLVVYFCKQRWNFDLPPEIAMAGVGLLMAVVGYFSPILRRELKL